MANIFRWFAITLFLVVHLNISYCELGILSGNKQQRGRLTGNEKHIIHRLQYQLKNQEDELIKTERINKNFERLIQLVHILGQVDTFLSDRTRALIKKLAVLADDEERSYRY